MDGAWQTMEGSLFQTSGAKWEKVLGPKDLTMGPWLSFKEVDDLKLKGRVQTDMRFLREVG